MKNMQPAIPREMSPPKRIDLFIPLHFLGFPFGHMVRYVSSRLPTGQTEKARVTQRTSLFDATAFGATASKLADRRPLQRQTHRSRW